MLTYADVCCRRAHTQTATCATRNTQP
jgi:hypothetical protein